MLGLLQREPTDYLQGRTTVITPAVEQLRIEGQAPPISVGYSPQKIERLIAERSAARKSKNFAEADRIRKELLDAGIILEDGPKGTTWRRN